MDRAAVGIDDEGHGEGVAGRRSIGRAGQNCGHRTWSRRCGRAGTRAGRSAPCWSRRRPPPEAAKPAVPVTETMPAMTPWCRCSMPGKHGRDGVDHSGQVDPDALVEDLVSQSAGRSLRVAGGQHGKVDGAELGVLARRRPATDAASVTSNGTTSMCPPTLPGPLVAVGRIATVPSTAGEFPRRPLRRFRLRRRRPRRPCRSARCRLPGHLELATPR